MQTITTKALFDFNPESKTKKFYALVSDSTYSQQSLKPIILNCDIDSKLLPCKSCWVQIEYTIDSSDRMKKPTKILNITEIDSPLEDIKKSSVVDYDFRNLYPVRRGYSWSSYPYFCEQNDVVTDPHPLIPVKGPELVDGKLKIRMDDNYSIKYKILNRHRLMSDVVGFITNEADFIPIEQCQLYRYLWQVKRTGDGLSYDSYFSSDTLKLLPTKMYVIN